MKTTKPKATDPLIDKIISVLKAKGVRCGTGAAIKNVRKEK